MGLLIIKNDTQKARRRWLVLQTMHNQLKIVQIGDLYFSITNLVIITCDESKSEIYTGYPKKRHGIFFS